MNNENPFTPPSSNLDIDPEKLKQRSPITKLPRISTLLVVVLSIVTAGIYNLYWMYTRTQKLNALAQNEDRIASWLPTAAIMISLISLVMTLGVEFTHASDGFLVLANLISISNFVLTIMWVFAIRKIIHRIAGLGQQDEYWLHGVLTFLLSIYYFQYRINQIHDSEQFIRA